MTAPAPPSVAMRVPVRGPHQFPVAPDARTSAVRDAASQRRGFRAVLGAGAEYAGILHPVRAGMSTATAPRSAPLAGGAFVEAARPVLLQLRLGLAGRTLPREQADRILDLVRHHLEQADRILRDQQASSLDQAIRGKLGSHAEFGGPVSGQLHLLGEMIARLYDDAGYAASLVPSR